MGEESVQRVRGWEGEIGVDVYLVEKYILENIDYCHLYISFLTLVEASELPFMICCSEDPGKGVQHISVQHKFRVVASGCVPGSSNFRVSRMMSDRGSVLSRTRLCRDAFSKS